MNTGWLMMVQAQRVRILSLAQQIQYVHIKAERIGEESHRLRLQRGTSIE